MAIVSIAAYPALGYGISADPAMVIEPSTRFSSAFDWNLNVVAGDQKPIGHIRTKNNTTGGTNGTYASATAWHRIDWSGEVLPVDQEIYSIIDNANTLNGTIRVRAADNKLRYHDFAAKASGTATATCDNAITPGVACQILLGLNYTAQTVEMLVYQAGALVATIPATSCNVNGAQYRRAVQSWQYQFPIDGDGWEGDSAATFQYRYGVCLVDDAAYPPLTARVGVQWAIAEGTHTGWSLGAGASKVAAVSGAPIDGDTSYIVSTSANAAQTYTLTPCAACNPPITGTILACCPFIDPWDASGVTSAVRIIENGLTTTSSLISRGSTHSLHLGSALYNQTTLLPSGAPLTIANLNAMEVGIVRNNATTEIRCGSVGNLVVYVPGPLEFQRLSYSRLSLGRLATERLSL